MKGAAPRRVSILFGGRRHVMGERLFTADKAWSGPSYELALEFSPRSDDRLRAALEALWSHPDLDGCYLDRDCEPADQPRKQPDLESGHLLGVARLPHGSRVVCGSLLRREVEGDSDWLDFYLPMGSLWTAFGGFLPSGPDWPEDPWLLEVDDWLAKVGLWIARSASFRLGLIGPEVGDGQTHAADITMRGIPAKRFVGYLWPSGGSPVYHRRTWGETASGPYGT
jgi:hypothetical protein